MRVSKGPTRRSIRHKGFSARKTFFLCYRSIDAGWALAIAQYLRTYGYGAFLAHQSMTNGPFKKVILKEIRTRAHFLVLLTPTSLDRCKEAEDWLRLEIEQALATKRNIIPVMLEGFDFNTPEIAAKLTGKLALLKEYHGLIVPKQLFEEAMTRLIEEFLR